VVKAKVKPRKVKRGNVKHRSLIFVFVMLIITCGIYAIYWFYKTKEEINSLGASIPTFWLIIIPIANLYWMYKYCEGFSEHVKKDNNAILWFILYIIISIIPTLIFQSELNKLAKK
jgi:ABC-type transport system involved in cytochrome c biogenesis permease subunit